MTLPVMILAMPVKDVSAVDLIHTDFPAGTFVIPMDEKQTALTADDTTVYGFIWRLLNDGATCYRIIQPPVDNLNTEELGSVTYSGGPILVMAEDEAILTAALADFPTVTVHKLAQPFSSDRVFVITEPTRILVINGVWGDTEVDLDEMGIPYDIVETSDIEANPDMIFDYNLVVDDCPGWSSPDATPGTSGIPSSVANKFREFVSAGGEVIFTDISLDDLAVIFPNYISVAVNEDGVWDVDIHNPPVTSPPLTTGEFQASTRRRFQHQLRFTRWLVDG